MMVMLTLVIIHALVYLLTDQISQAKVFKYTLIIFHLSVKQQCL